LTSLDRVASGPRERVRNWQLRTRRKVLESDGPALLFLVALTVAFVVGGIIEVDLVPQTTILLPIFLASLWLGPRTLHQYAPLDVPAR